MVSFNICNFPLTYNTFIYFFFVNTCLQLDKFFWEKIIIGLIKFAQKIQTQSWLKYSKLVESELKILEITINKNWKYV